jgi:hypothetical protein
MVATPPASQAAKKTRLLSAPAAIETRKRTLEQFASG